MPFKKKKILKKNKSNNLKDKGDVRRLFSPFNRFANSSLRIADKRNLKTMSYKSELLPTGLSPKEKSYVICSCQTRSNRYAKLKILAAHAIKYNKIFSIYGSCNIMRNALQERGWIEKILPNHMNLSKIRNGSCSNRADIHSELERLLLSNFVEKYSPNFIWRTKDEQRDTTIDMTKECTTLINKLQSDALWTSKLGLCSSMKRNCWFFIEDVAEVSGPRSYNCGEIDSFVKDYNITACTSLLKWILSMVANERPVFDESGTISINILVFALNRCKEYLFRKQHKDIDRSLTHATSTQWNAFLKKYYRIISNSDVFQVDKENKLPLYLGYANFLLKQIHKYRPQLSCEGCHNIWIIKPAHCSRGRGIRMASQLEIINSLLNKANSKYVVQKYIEEPLLIHETKFDIRQYYLVTSTYPLVIWMYRDCYLKFSSQKYSIKDYDESIHLTNNAVQRKYTNCVGRHSDLPPDNMWDLDKYKEYLSRIGKNKVWDNIIYSGMKKSIIGTMLSCQDSLPVCKNRFELYGCDFILDKEYKPWLIEINSCPDLNHTTHVTAKICPAVVSDIIKVVVDFAADPNSSTGRFECMVDMVDTQPMTIPRYGGAADINVRGYALPFNYFYRGNIEISEVYNNVDIDKEYDMKTILNKLEAHYDMDVMVVPDDKCDSHKDIATFVDNSKTELELSVAATVITEQLEELLDRIPSEQNNSKSVIKCRPILTHSIKNTASSVQGVKSATDIKSFIKNSYTRFEIVQPLNMEKKQSSEFSKLDDGPNGKGSGTELNSPEKSVCNLSTVVKTVKYVKF